MSLKKRDYYRRGREYLDDEIRSSIIETANEIANELVKKGDKDKMRKFLEVIQESSYVQDVLEKMSKDIVIQSRSDVKAAVKFENKQKSGFEARLYKSYKRSIEAYIELMGVSLEAIENHRKITHDNLGEKDDFLPFLLRLHARIQRTANEILALMRSGYGSGALARWRSMHETTVIMAYAKEKGPRIIKFMQDHEAISSYKAMKVYQANATQLGQKPYTAYEMKLAKAKYDRRIKKYDSNFKKDYGWLRAASGNTLNNFRELEDHVGIGHLYPYYKLSSLNVHMEWRSLIVGEEFEALNDPGVALVGPADYGFEDAISLSLLTLSHATIMILTYNLSYESLLYAKTILLVEKTAQEKLARDIETVKKRGN